MCSVEGCQTVVGIRLGMCQMHYTRMRRTGTTEFQRPSLMDRFHAGINKDESSGCWLWKKATCSRGYGAIQLGVGVTGKAHRVSWELFRGPIPDGAFVLHKCDVRNCCNPEHLFIGDHDDNMRDMVSKGRSPSGSRNRNAKLGADQVSRVLSDSRPATVVGPEMGVHPETIRRIRMKKSWKTFETQTQKL